MLMPLSPLSEQLLEKVMLFVQSLEELTPQLLRRLSQKLLGKNFIRFTLKVDSCGQGQKRK